MGTGIKTAMSSLADRSGTRLRSVNGGRAASQAPRQRAVRKRKNWVRGTAAGRPELRLANAVLEEALLCFQRHLGATTAKGRRLFREAHAWIFEEPDRLPFSFEHVCAVLDINAPYLRRKLLEWEAARVRGTDAAPIASIA